ncbi:hypothetical protein AB0903_26525 [Streptomyces sp. NPDC048389]|uniref:hypothetical protein n=1 Tax=Streptomyces sp. NPDC048389 TaxID=3154622 RepID=UPI003451E5D6
MAETKKNTTRARTSSAGTRARQAEDTVKDTVKDTAEGTGLRTVESVRGIGDATTQKAATAARTVQRTAVSAAGTAAGKAGVVWTLVKERKAVVAGAGTGVATVVAGSYALGRRVGLRQRGPLSRLTGGRL